jgi:hypothetical protein
VFNTTRELVKEGDPSCRWSARRGGHPGCSGNNSIYIPDRRRVSTHLSCSRLLSRRIRSVTVRNRNLFMAADTTYPTLGVEARRAGVEAAEGGAETVARSPAEGVEEIA